VRVDAKGEFAGYLEPRGATSPVTPAAFKIGPGDAVYILDVVAGRVVVVGGDGRVEREIALPRPAEITDLAADASGRIYVVDAVKARVFSAEKGALAFEPLGDSLKEVMSFPIYLASDGRGKLYVVDQNGNAVVRLGVDGKFLGRELAMGWTEGTVYYPAQLCLNSQGDAFLADRNNNRVQVFATPR
jgi:hypothetical protein